MNEVRPGLAATGTLRTELGNHTPFAELAVLAPFGSARGWPLSVGAAIVLCVGDTRKEAAAFPLAFIIGAMKCGTTSLFNYLAEHPEVAPCSTKEPDFFCREDLHEDQLAEYFALWEWREGVHKVAIEASANYTKIPSNPDCGERIARFPDLDVRFIYCMRNPIDRIASHVYHGLYAGWTRPLEEGISDHLINCSRYAMQLDAYASRFDRDRILLVVLEEFRKAPEAGLRRIFEFLGLDPDFEVPELDRPHNVATDHFKEHPAWNRLRNVGYARALARVVPPSLRQALRRKTGHRVEARRTLTPEEEAMVLSQLKSDLERLRAEYGIDPATAWGIDLR